LLLCKKGDEKKMNKRFEWLKCERCNAILERMFSNEQLNAMYPVSDKKVMDAENDNNMRMQMFSKRLWRCPLCGLKKELNNKEFMRIMLDFKRRRYLE